MQKLKLVTPMPDATLPGNLSLLFARVVIDEPSAPGGEVVGRTQGALVDDRGRVLGFLVHLADRLVIDGWTLVPRGVVRPVSGEALEVAWSEDRLMAQPRLVTRADDEDGVPVEAEFTEASRRAIPPSPDTDAKELVKETLVDGAVGGALGAVTGFALGGPVAAAATAAFFAIGGGLTGFIAGGAREPAGQSNDIEEANDDLEQRPREPRLDALEGAIVDGVVTGRLRMTEFELLHAGEAGMDQPGMNEVEMIDEEPPPATLRRPHRGAA